MEGWDFKTAKSLRVKMSHPNGLWIAATCHKVTAKITIDFRPHQDAVTGLRILTIISSNNYIHIVAQYLLHSHT